MSLSIAIPLSLSLLPSNSSAMTGNWATNAPTVGTGYTTTGKFVSAIQINLWAAGYSGTVGTIDGQYGTNTKNALISFQKKYGLTADGIAGSKTWGKMQSQLVDRGIRADGWESYKYDPDNTSYYVYWEDSYRDEILHPAYWAAVLYNSSNQSIASAKLD